MPDSEDCTCFLCPRCHGTGRLIDSQPLWDDGQGEQTCDDCGGSGIEVECDYCHEQRDREADHAG